MSVAVAPRFLHALGFQPRLVEMTKGGNAGGRPPPPLSFQLNRGIRVDLPAPSFRAQSRNLTIKPGRFHFVRRCRSEISPRARLSASLGRNDKRGKRGRSTCSPCHFVMSRGIRVDLPAPSFRAQSRNLTIKPGRFPFVRRCRSEISPRARRGKLHSKRAA